MNYGREDEDPYSKRREARDRKMAEGLGQIAAYAPGVGTAAGTLGGALVGGVAGGLAAGGPSAGLGALPGAISGAATGAGVGGALGTAAGGLVGMGAQGAADQMMDPYEQRRMEREERMMQVMQLLGPYYGG